MIQTLIAAVGLIAGVFLAVVFVVLITTSWAAFGLAFLVFGVPFLFFVYKFLRAGERDSMWEPPK